MFIAVSGPQCSGKTTLLNAIKTVPDMHAEAEYVREASRKGFPVNESADNHDLSQIYLNSHDIVTLGDNHGCIHSHCNHIVQDRCLADKLVYSTYLARRNKLSHWVLDQVQELFKRYVNQYDAIFYTNPDDVELVADGFRSTNSEFRSEITKIFEDEILSRDLPQVFIVHGNKDKRVAQVMQVMDGLCRATGEEIVTCWNTRNTP